MTIIIWGLLSQVNYLIKLRSTYFSIKSTFKIVCSENISIHCWLKDLTSGAFQFIKEGTKF